MAGNGRYELHLVKIDATSLDEIVASAVTPNGDANRMRALGSIDPTVSFFRGQAPVCRFSTLKVGTALAAVGIDGLDVTTGLELGFVEKAQGGAFEAGGEKVVAAKSLIVPESLSVSQGGDAILSYMAYCYSSNGILAPLVHTASLPTGTPAVSELFTLGTVTVNSTPLGQVLGWNLSFGIGVEVHNADGLLYPTRANLMGPRSPVCEVTVADMAEITDTNLVGSEVDTVVLNLIKRSTTGGGLAGSGDKTLTFAKATMDVSDGGGSFPGESATTLRFLPRKSGATALIAIA